MVPLSYGSWGGWEFLILDIDAGTLTYSMTDTRGGAEDESTVILAREDLEKLKSSTWQRPTQSFLEIAKQSLYYFHCDPKPF